jgi:hypothetical protein
MTSTLMLSPLTDMNPREMTLLETGEPAGGCKFTRNLKFLSGSVAKCAMLAVCVTGILTVSLTTW